MRYLVEVDPDDVDSVTLDWHRWLDGDVLASSAWAVEPPGDIELPGDLGGEAGTRDATTTTVWYRAGAEGAAVRLVNTVETEGGRRTQRVVRVQVRSR